jgi:hypothetical protein
MLYFLNWFKREFKVFKWLRRVFSAFSLTRLPSFLFIPAARLIKLPRVLAPSSINWRVWASNPVPRGERAKHGREVG